MKRWILMLLLALTSNAWAAPWSVDGKWVSHDLPADRAENPLAVRFSLPDYVTRHAKSSIPQWNYMSDDAGDYFQVLFGGHDPVVLRASDPTMTDAQATEALYQRTLAEVRQETERYRLVDAAFPVKGAAKALLYEEVDSPSDVAVQRQALEEAFASLPPAEREREIQKNLAELASKRNFHLAAFAAGKKLLVTVHFTKQQGDAKKQILDRFLRSLEVR